MRKKIPLYGSLIILSFVVVSHASALEISIENNGSETESTTEAAYSQQTTVSQTNETSASTTIASEAATGDNLISGTSGENRIITGDSQQAVKVENDLNANVISDQQCCGTPDQISITGNGTNSSNSVNLSTSNTTVINSHNESSGVNSTHMSSKTGGNEISQREGDSLIKSGDIRAGYDIHNVENHTTIKVCCQDNDGLVINISGNGARSENSVHQTSQTLTIVEQHNISFLKNELLAELITGENKVESSRGETVIRTGDIILGVAITTKGNENNTQLNCCQTNNPNIPTHPNPPTPPTPHTTTPPTITPDPIKPATTTNSSTHNHHLDPSLEGRVLGASDAILPATGSRHFLWMLIANILTFLFGCYLRRFSGRAPSLAQVKVF